MELKSTEGGKYVYSINFQNMAASTFKFAHCDGWKITLDVDGKVKAETSLGTDLKAGGSDISINPGADVTITFTFDLAAGDHSKSFSWKAEGVNENYSPANFVVGVSGDLHSSVGNWSTPEGATLAVYNETESDPANGTFVYYVEACPFKANAQFKFRKDGDWYGPKTDFIEIVGAEASPTTGDDPNYQFDSEAGTYKIKVTITCDGLTIKKYKAEFTKVGDLPADVTPEQPETPVETMKFIVKVNKAIDWPDKYFYAWADGVTLPGWPGVKMDFQGEEGDYYVYYTMIPKSLDGKTLNYIINNNSGAQTKDLSIAISGETTATVEAADKK
jgi:hypothetical protein